MNWFRNLKISKKLFLGFGLVILLTILLSIASLFTIYQVSNKYNYLLSRIAVSLVKVEKVAIFFTEARRNNLVSTLYLGNKENLDVSYAHTTKCLDDASSRTREAIALLESDTIIDSVSKQDSLNKLNIILKSVDVDYRTMSESLYKKALNNDKDAVLELIFSGSKESDIISTNINAFMADRENYSLQLQQNYLNEFKQMITVLLFICGGIIICSIILSMIIAKTIKFSINNLKESATKVVSGDIHTKIDIKAKDEIGYLAKDISTLTNIFKTLFMEINQTAKQLKLGNFDARIDTTKFKGDYNGVACAINDTYDELIDVILEINKCIDGYSSGDFEIECKKFPGKLSLFTNRLDLLKNNLLNVSADIKLVIKSASNGQFDVLIDVSKYEGDWHNISSELNKLVNTIEMPINEVTDVLQEVASGNFDCSINGKYKGKFDIMKQSVNNTIKNTSTYIHDISGVLSNMANQNLDITIDKDYIGDFEIIKDALLEIISSFNRLIHEFNLSADRVTAGSKQISDSSMMLAHGATEQATAVEDLNQTLSIVSKQTIENATNAKKANDLAVQSKIDGIASKDEMEKMLQSMSDINDASLNISKIIKTIEDIAFQTNLLALNAAVEAARAGAHGKGFAVVAEEVRNLAVKSQAATIETADLINKTIDIVSNGTDIANSTASSINEMVNKISAIASIISEVSSASKAQEDAILKINNGIMQIANVTNTNTATSEETASSAEELSSQAQVFRNAIAKFELKVI